MSMEYWFCGRLEFSDQAAAASARRQLHDEGYDDDEDNIITPDDLIWKDTVLEINLKGSMPYSCFATSSDVLAIYAQHARSGEIVVVNIEDGVGERFHAGEADRLDELSDAEVDDLRKEYGWDVESNP